MELDNVSREILQVLTKGDYSSNEIFEQLTAKNGDITLNQPILYSTLRELEKEKYILSFWQSNEDGVKIHYYFITPLGLEILGSVSSEEKSTQDETNFPDNYDEDDDEKNFTLLDVDDENEKVEKTENNNENADNIVDFLKENKIKNNVEQVSTISTLSKRKNQKKIQKELEAEEIKAFMENSSENKKLDFFEEKQEIKPKKVQKYLFINQMNFYAQIVLLIISFLELSVFALALLALKEFSLVYIIIISVILALSLSLFFTAFYGFVTNKKQKIQQEVKWTKKLIVRIIVFCLLTVFAVSIVLITGYTNIFATDALFKWLIPSVYFLNIIIKWIILKLLSKKEKYITE